VGSRVYVVLVNWNGWADTVECMESLLRSDHPDFVIVVVDNGSSNDSFEKIRAWADGEVLAPETAPPALRHLTSPAYPKPIGCREIEARELECARQGSQVTRTTRALGRLGDEARVVLVRSSRNAGFGGGNNLAFELIRLRGDGDLVWVLNNDTVVTPGAMSDLVRAVRAGRGIVGATVRYYHQPDRVQVYGGGRMSRWTGRLRMEARRPPRRIDSVYGACFMLDAAALAAVGGFDEHIFMYYEENDLCLRAAHRGLRCAPSDAIIYHKHGAAAPDRDDSLAWHQVLQNKTYVLKKNWGLGLWFPCHVAAIALAAMGILATPGKRKGARAVLAGWWRQPGSAFQPCQPRPPTTPATP
jgi:GT2 family glycosyltransferase